MKSGAYSNFDLQQDGLKRKKKGQNEGHKHLLRDGDKTTWVFQNALIPVLYLTVITAHELYDTPIHHQ